MGVSNIRHFTAFELMKSDNHIVGGMATRAQGTETIERLTALSDAVNTEAEGRKLFEVATTEQFASLGEGVVAVGQAVATSTAAGAASTADIAGLLKYYFVVDAGSTRSND